MKYILSSFLALLFLSGCGQPQPSNLCSQKNWTLNPNQNNNIGAVGSAMRTYDQKTNTQRKLAITRALDELSLQQGVKVSLNMEKRETVVNGHVDSQMKTGGQYQTDNTITAHIEDACKAPSGEFFVWMVLD